MNSYERKIEREIERERESKSNLRKNHSLKLLKFFKPPRLKRSLFLLFFSKSDFQLWRNQNSLTKDDDWPHHAY